MIGFIFLLYAIFVAWLVSSRSHGLELEKKGYVFPVSIVVAYRNEEDNLRGLIERLCAQNYPNEKVQLILVNDHSTDGSELLIKEFEAKFKLTIVRKSLSEKKGKKAAIGLGIEAATNEIILCTDADCEFNPNWVESMLAGFQRPKINMIMGPVSLVGSKNWFEKLQEIEFSSLMAITLLTTRRNRPIISNGANIAFRKSAFENSNAYNSNAHINTGDDVFLLHQFKKVFGVMSIHFSEDENSLVETDVKRNLNSFLSQRIRWASKSKDYSDYDTIKIGALLMAINLTLIWSFFGMLFQSYSVTFFIGCFAIKWLLDLLIIQQLPLHIRPKSIVKWTFLLSIIYPYYSVGIALVSLFYRPEWKGRKI